MRVITARIEGEEARGSHMQLFPLRSSFFVFLLNKLNVCSEIHSVCASVK